MTMETTQGIRYNQDAADHAPNTEVTQQRNAILVAGGGANTDHFKDALRRLDETGHPFYVTDVGEPLVPVVPDRLCLVNTPEGQERVRRLFGSGVVHAVYLSLPPEIHQGAITANLGLVAQRQVDFVVVTKPAVRNLQEMHDVDACKKAAEEALREQGVDVDPEKNDLLYVHEHYIEKAAWHALRDQLSNVTDVLGRLRSMTVDIQEARTADDEGRTTVVADGALEDLGPHVISLGLDVQSSINTSSRYSIADRSDTSIERFRHEGSGIKDENVETAFIVRGVAQMVDNQTATTHDVPFIWRGGKGLVDSKKVVLEFEHPDTGELSTISVNLKTDTRTNTLDIPRSVSHLFPEIEFVDDGYGQVVEKGLGGNNPGESFQSWEKAKIVTKWIHHLARQDPPLHIHKKGVSLQELDLVSAR